MTHKFERAGLGIAPFVYLGMHESVYVACPGAPVQPAGCCDYCGNGIRYCCNIRSADGKEFVVGTECVRKVDSVANVSRMESDVQKLAREKRQAAAAARKAKRQAEYEANLQAQRDQNGGKTDWEVKREAEASARKAELEAARGVYSDKNKWLIDILRDFSAKYGSEFAASISKDLEVKSLSSFSPRAIGIMEDLYAKWHGRGGSKANTEARRVFQERLEDVQVSNSNANLSLARGE